MGQPGVWAHTKLGEMGECAAVATPFLIEKLYDSEQLVWIEKTGHAKWKDKKHTTVEQEAFLAIVKIGNPSVSHLINSLNTTTGKVRLSVIRALGRIGDTRAVSSLNVLTESKNPRVVSVAQEALKNIESTKDKEQ